MASAVRRGYLDWMRGLAVLIMIEAHTIDSWTRAADRRTTLFGYAMIAGGFGAPIFLFLAGLAVTLSAGSKARKSGAVAAGAAAVRRRGWEIFGLAFLFRLQSYILTPGGALAGLLKVDILNIMGPGIVLAATIWGAFRSDRPRVIAFAAATAAVAMLTPIVRMTPLLEPLPDPLEWYLRPYPGRTNFTVFPWCAFVFAGAAMGVLIDGARDPARERRLNGAFALAGAALAVGGYLASYLPSIYTQSNFWTSSPTFFFLRTGILMMTTAIVFVWDRRPWAPAGAEHAGVWSPMREFGRASLFVYWIHVEMVYGVLTQPLHKRLPIGWAFAAFTLFSLFLFGIAMSKNALVARWHQRRPRAAP